MNDFYVVESRNWGSKKALTAVGKNIRRIADKYGSPGRYNQGHIDGDLRIDAIQCSDFQAAASVFESLKKISDEVGMLEMLECYGGHGHDHQVVGGYTSRNCKEWYKISDESDTYIPFKKSKASLAVAR